jgi:hypothetical protein
MYLEALFEHVRIYLCCAEMCVRRHQILVRSAPQAAAARVHHVHHVRNSVGDYYGSCYKNKPTNERALQSGPCYQREYTTEFINIPNHYCFIHSFDVRDAVF